MLMEAIATKISPSPTFSKKSDSNHTKTVRDRTQTVLRILWLSEIHTSRTMRTAGTFKCERETVRIGGRGIKRGIIGEGRGWRKLVLGQYVALPKHEQLAGYRRWVTISHTRLGVSFFARDFKNRNTALHRPTGIGMPVPFCGLSFF